MVCMVTCSERHLLFLSLLSYSKMAPELLPSSYLSFELPFQLRIELEVNLLKPGQFKQGQNFFQLHRFLNTFLQLVAEKKYAEKRCSLNFFCPSYFVTALDTYY